MSHETKTEAPREAGLFGYLAEYKQPADVVHAAEKVRDAGFKVWDTYTPFPIHGMDGAMGIKLTRLPAIVLCFAILGSTTGLLLQWWTNAVDYQFLISGKPLWSLPANVPVIFELTILFSAFATLFGMLIMNNLPAFSHPLDLKRRFARVTNDRFFLFIETRDPKFDETETWKLLEETHPEHLDEVKEDIRSAALPKVLVYALVVIGCFAAVPFALVTRARYQKSREPRIHVVPDMDWQPKYKAQRQNTFFANDNATRLPVDGTVARGQLRADDHLYQGQVGGTWARAFPPAIEATPENLARGEERYNIYCAPCHGIDGKGKGMVHQRAAALKQGSWVPPSNLHQDYLRTQPVGQLFNSITYGVRNMPGYAAQIEPDDRWKIIMYLRALQKTSKTPVGELPAAEKAKLK